MKNHFLYMAVAFAIAAAGVYWLMLPVEKEDGSIAADLPGSAIAQDDNSEELDISSVVEMALGPEEAAVTIYEYASFTCPHCADFHKNQYRDLKRDYIDTGKIRFIYRDVYFDRFGLWASMVARCDGERKFFAIADMIYQRQREWIGDGTDPLEIANSLRTIGKVAGLEEDRLETCLSDVNHARTLVAWYEKNREEHDISSTPSLIVNGKKYSNMQYSELKAIIDDLLEQ
ncbi:MAG: DsbA family protein [Roseovarius sp.]|nr:DsbA family protein [Roseovarius sp.]